MDLLTERLFWRKKWALSFDPKDAKCSVILAVLDHAR
jgi:hypothetical protein